MPGRLDKKTGRLLASLEDLALKVSSLMALASQLSVMEVYQLAWVSQALAKSLLVTLPAIL
jgi:hypothetical protein